MHLLISLFSSSQSHCMLIPRPPPHRSSSGKNCFFLLNVRILTICSRVCGLQVPVKKKIKAICLLGAGGVATGASIVRLFLVFQPNSFADETVSFVRFNLLACVNLLLVPQIDLSADENILQSCRNWHWHYLCLSTCVRYPLPSMVL